MAEERLTRAIDKVRALYLTRDLAAEEKQMEIIHLAGKLLVGLYEKGQYAMFVEFWKCLNDKADDMAREILQPLVKERLYGEVEFGNEDIRVEEESQIDDGFRTD